MATPSPLNSGYAPGSLAGRPPVSVGGPMTASRRFGQLSRRAFSQGDLAGSAQALGLSERLGMGFPMPMRGGPPMGMPMMSPGRGAAMGAPPPMMMPQERQAPVLDAGTGMPVPPPMDVPMPDLPVNAGAMEPAAPPMSFEQAFQQSPLGLSGPPPMSTAMQVPFDTPPEMMGKLNAGSFAGVYGRAPAPYEAMPIPGTGMMGILRDGKTLGQVVPNDTPKPTGYAPVQGRPGLMVPTGPGADRLPTMQQVRNAGGRLSRKPDQFRPVDEAAPKAPSGIQYTYDAAGNVTGGFYPRYNPATGRFVISKLDLDGDGVPDVQQGGAGAAAGAAKVPAWKSLMQ